MEEDFPTPEIPQSAPTGNNFFSSKMSPVEAPGIESHSYEAIHEQARFGADARRLKLEENALNRKSMIKESAGNEEVVRGPLRANQSMKVRDFVAYTVKEMDEKNAFDKFMQKSDQTKIKKFKWVLNNVASRIEKKPVRLDGYMHRGNALTYGKNLISGKETFKEEKKACYTDLQARKTMGGVVAGLTENKIIGNWSKRK